MKRRILVTIAAVLSLCMVASGKNESTSQEQRYDDMVDSAKVKIEVSNADIIKDEATIFIVDSNTVIAAYLSVYPDGSINDDKILLHPNEDYRMVLQYNEVSEVKEFHTGVGDGQYYTLSIDYATGDVVFSHDEKWQKILESGDFRYYVNDDKTVTVFGWSGANNEVVIPEEIDGHTVTMIGDYVFYQREGLTSVVIPDTVTTIGERAFYQCKNLSVINLPDALTTIGDYAFGACDNLTLVVAQDSYAAQYAEENDLQYTYTETQN